ncbi:MAG: choice-of-anchor J domain-containing protein [Bacteroidales bacterium]|nr:choice-of-anchor J domain-containing protein [Bacteroidales bacterium]
MKTRTILRTLVLMAGLVFYALNGWGQIISQYVETNSGTVPKGIEIWNNTENTLDFSVNNLIIQQGTNGAALNDLAGTLVNSGSLAPGAVMVIGTTDMGTYLTDQGLTSVTFVSFTFVFNGDDALAVKYGGIITDVFGTPEFDPGSAWTGNGVSTANQNIQLKSGITTGDLVGWSDPSIRFETVSTNPVGIGGLEGFGIAPVSAEDPVITVDPVVLSGFEYLLGEGPSDEQFFTVSGAALIDDISLTAPTNYEISETSGSGFNNSIVLMEVDGTVSETTIYVRLKAGLAIGEYNNEAITLSSTDATEKTVTLNGEIREIATTTLPYGETFDADLGDSYAYSVLGNTRFWNWNLGGWAQMNGFGSAETEEDWLILPGINLNNYSGEIMTFESWKRFGSDDANNYLKLLYSTDYTGTGDPSAASWNELTFTQPAVEQVWTPSGDVDLSGISGTSVWIAFKYRYEFGNYRLWQIDNIVIQEVSVENPVSFAATTINSNQINLDFEINASGDDVVIVYNSTGIFSDPSGDPPAINDPFAGGTLFYYGTESPQIHSGLAAEETVYYRAFSYDKEFYSPGLNANATTYAVEPSNHVTGLSATANSASSITVAWTDSDASGYLIKGSTVDFNDITAPVDGISEADGALVKNVAAGVESHEFTGLAASTEHFFKIFPYNGVGAAVNYKTDGTIPEASATTLDPPPPPYVDVLLRPQQIDLSATTSQSAVLMEIGNYPTDDVRYRLYNGSNQYNCWDGTEYISSFSYSVGPQVPGTPTTSAKFWILFERGNNNSTAASYRDRLGPLYPSNYQTEALPAATAMVTPYDISLSIPFTGTYALDVKYVVLGFDAEVDGNLISATSSDLTTGDFVLKADEGTIIRRIEVRTVLDVLVDELIGEWPSAVPENRTVDGITLGVDDTECYDATNNITVTNTTIGNGASVEFRAGVNIILGDGFSAVEGSYMLATITDVYCTLPPAMLASEEIIVPEIQNAIDELETTFKVYPNPSSGVFALELSGLEQTEKVTVEIYGMMGERVLQSDLSGSQIYQFDMSAMPRGVYILRIMHSGQAEIQRIIKQ